MARRPSITGSLAAEAVGTGFLVVAVVGSGVAATQLSPSDTGLQLFESSAATAGALVALICAFAAVSGAHFNPVVTVAEVSAGRLRRGAATPYVVAQVIGGCAGVVIANVMFELPAVELSTHDRLTAATFLAEVVATFGLITIILGAVRGGQPMAVPLAVAGYIGAAYWFTSSTSFANPAVTIARTLTDTFAGIAPSSAPGFIAAQLLGGVLAVVFGRLVFADRAAAIAGAVDA